MTIAPLHPEDRVFRTRAVLVGGHWHVSVYSAKRADLIFAKIGDLTMDEADYRRFLQLWPAQHIDDTEKGEPS